MVAIGHVTWNVGIEELIPQIGRGAEDTMTQPTGQKLKTPKSAPMRPLEAFDEE